MKPVKSILIYSFLDHVSKGLIGADTEKSRDINRAAPEVSKELISAGKDVSSGPARLEQMCQALVDILEGENADDVFQITRVSGESNEKYRKYEPQIHEMRKRGFFWKQIDAQLDFNTKNNDFQNNYNARREHLLAIDSLFVAFNDSKDAKDNAV